MDTTQPPLSSMMVHPDFTTDSTRIAAVHGLAVRSAAATADERIERTHGLPYRLAALVVALACLLVPPADAQSDASVEASAASVMASAEIPVAVSDALARGAAFVVTGIAVSGTVALVTVSVVGVGVSFVVHLSIEALHASAVGVGETLDVVTTGAGWLLRAGGHTLCYVANDAARAHIHTRTLDT